MPDTAQGSLLKCPPGRGEKGNNDFIFLFRSLIFRHVSTGHYYAHRPNEATDSVVGGFTPPSTPQLQELKALASV